MSQDNERHYIFEKCDNRNQALPPYDALLPLCVELPQERQLEQHQTNGTMKRQEQEDLWSRQEDTPHA
jgi:hypothetical protein